MKNAKNNFVFFIAITFAIFSILFTVSSSAILVNFNPDSSKTMALFSSIIKGDLFLEANAQDGDGGGGDSDNGGSDEESDLDYEGSDESAEEGSEEFEEKGLSDDETDEQDFEDFEDGGIQEENIEEIDGGREETTQEIIEEGTETEDAEKEILESPVIEDDGQQEQINPLDALQQPNPLTTQQQPDERLMSQDQIPQSQSELQSEQPQIPETPCIEGENCPLPPQPCPEGEVLQNGVCAKPPQEQSEQPYEPITSCIEGVDCPIDPRPPQPCPDGQVLIDGECIKEPTCPPGQERIADGCVEQPIRDQITIVDPTCPSGQRGLSDGKCVPPIYPPLTCPDGQVLIDGECTEKPTCPDSQVLIDGECIKEPTCPTGQAYSVEEGKCVPDISKVCQPGQVFQGGICRNVLQPDFGGGGGGGSGGFNFGIDRGFDVEGCPKAFIVAVEKMKIPGCLVQSHKGVGTILFIGELVRNVVVGNNELPGVILSMSKNQLANDFTGQGVLKQLNSIAQKDGRSFEQIDQIQFNFKIDWKPEPDTSVNIFSYCTDGNSNCKSHTYSTIF